MNSELKSNIKINRSSEKNFGIVFSIIFLIISFYLNNYTTVDKNYVYVLIFLSFLFLILAFFFSKVLYYPNFVWFKFGMFLSMIISPIIMFLVFCIAFVLFGLIIRLFKGNLLQTRFENNKKTYWEKREHEIQDMKNQF